MQCSASLFIQNVVAPDTMPLWQAPCTGHISSLQQRFERWTQGGAAKLAVLRILRHVLADELAISNPR